MNTFSLSPLPRIAAMAVALAAAWPALADGPFPAMLSDADRQRLASHDEARQATLDYVRSHASGEDTQALAVMELPAAEVAPADMAGNWRCRVLLLGQDASLPLVVYPDFRCRITDDEAGLRLQKLTGSQRTAGTFYDVGETRLGYAGALALGTEKTRPRYGEDAERNQVGYLVPLSPTHLRLELPGRAGAGSFEVLELRR